MFGAALFLAFAQTDLTNSLQKALPEFAPEANIQAVLAAGATGFRTVIPESSVEGVVLAYNKSINHVFYIAAGGAVGAFVFTWGLGWKSVKKSKNVAPEA